MGGTLSRYIDGYESLLEQHVELAAENAAYKVLLSAVRTLPNDQLVSIRNAISREKCSEPKATDETSLFQALLARSYNYHLELLQDQVLAEELD